MTLGISQTPLLNSPLKRKSMLNKINSPYGITLKGTDVKINNNINILESDSRQSGSPESKMKERDGKVKTCDRVKEEDLNRIQQMKMLYYKKYDLYKYLPSRMLNIKTLSPRLYQINSSIPTPISVKPPLS